MSWKPNKKQLLYNHFHNFILHKKSALCIIKSPIFMVQQFHCQWRRVQRNRKKCFPKVAFIFQKVFGLFPSKYYETCTIIGFNFLNPVYWNSMRHWRAVFELKTDFQTIKTQFCESELPTGHVLQYEQKRDFST